MRQTEWVIAGGRDIGAGGAFITTDSPEPPETEIVLELVLPTSDQMFTLSAVARWTSPTGWASSSSASPPTCSSS